jgi:hypothetical protein
VTHFENQADRNHIKYDRSNLGKAIAAIEGYWQKDFKNIESEEKTLMNNISAAIERIGVLSVLMPTTFYMYTANEVSSCGYGNYLSFYEYVLAMRVKFVRFWIDRVYYHDPQELVSFIKADENIYRGRSLVPHPLLPGLVLMLFYSSLLLFYGYIRFKRVLYPRAEQARAFDHLDIKLERDKKYTYQSHGHDFVNQFLNVFSGKPRRVKMKVSISNQELTPGVRQDFLYVPHPDSFPGDLNAKYLLAIWQGTVRVSRTELNRVKQSLGEELLGKRFYHLKLKDKARVVLLVAGLSQSRVVILKDFLFGIPKEEREELENLAGGLKKEGGILIDLSTLNSYSIHSDVTATISYRDGYYNEVR